VVALRTSIVEFSHWLKAQWVAEVPEDLAICEFECRKSQCSSDDWARCVRRVCNTPKSLMLLRRSVDDVNQSRDASLDTPNAATHNNLLPSVSHAPEPFRTKGERASHDLSASDVQVFGSSEGSKSPSA